MQRHGYVYILTNRPYGTLCTGVTGNLHIRLAMHREGTGSAFARTYRLTRLVYVERCDRVAEAIHREKTLRKWRRDWKIRLIEGQNPDWSDLAGQLPFD